MYMQNLKVWIQKTKKMNNSMDHHKDYLVDDYGAVQVVLGELHDAAADPQTGWMQQCCHRVHPLPTHIHTYTLRPNTH